MSRKKEKEIVRGVTVESVGAEGKAIAHIDGKVVFVSNAVPGDVIAVRIDKRREKYFEGTLVEIEQPELPYPLQLKYKQQQVVDQFSRIGHLPMDQVEVLPILPSERTTEYRNKLEFTFSDRRWLLSGEDPSTVFDPPVPLDPSEFEGGVFPRHLRGGYSKYWISGTAGCSRSLPTRYATSSGSTPSCMGCLSSTSGSRPDSCAISSSAPICAGRSC